MNLPNRLTVTRLVMAPLFFLIFFLVDLFPGFSPAVYAVLLLGMCYAALRHRNLWLILGALLFVSSDFTLGIHLFVQRVPHSTMCIMIPYYLGQLLLFVGIQKRTLQQ